ncbi:MAG: metallophosphoesterase family protein [Verrucomicrobia bacterium]|nr:metallophosphoesterase family protein [Verrucomicrobiota bacterium]
MRILIVSDIHGNWPALQAVLAAAPPTDEVLCLGDLVNYGPQPAECVGWAMNQVDRDWVVQGNHDRALGRGEDPHCSVAYAALAAATQSATEGMLNEDMKRFLASLEPLQRFQLGEAVFVACHAVPSDPLYHYLPDIGPVTLWESELNGVGWPDFLLLGHTHLPMKTRFRKTLVVNPGSVGQPKDGDARAAYALWEDGDITLHRTAYDIEATLRAYGRLNLDPQMVAVLAEVLRTGGHLPLDQTPGELLQTFYRQHPDKLEAIFYLQKLLNRRVGLDTDRLDDRARQHWTLNYCRALVQQTARLTECVPWKWWATYEKFDKPHARIEIAELLHLVISLAQVLELTPQELFELHTKQHRLGLLSQEPTGGTPPPAKT